jgi:transcription-repair coupling factor (superfamily II helicase)
MHELTLPSDRPLWTISELAERLAAEPGASFHAVRAGGGVAALVVRAVALRTERPIIVVAPRIDRARELASDLGLWLGERRPVLLFDLAEPDPYADVVPDRRAAQGRLATLFELSRRPSPAPVVVMSATALVRKVVPTGVVAEATRLVRRGEEIDRDELVASLTSTGYLRVPLVEDPGTVSARGSLVDVWPSNLDAPVRIELDGDLVVSIKGFDPTDQRTSASRNEVWLVPALEARLGDDRRAESRLRDRCDEVNWPTTKTRALVEDLILGRAVFGAHGFLPAFVDLSPLFEQLPREPILVVEEPAAVRESLEESRETILASEVHKSDQPHFPSSAFLVEEEALAAWVGAQTSIALSQNPVIGGDGPLAELTDFDDDTPSLTAYDQSSLTRAVTAAQKAGGHASGLAPVVEHVEACHQAGLGVVFAARAVTQAERLASMLRGRGLDVVFDPEPSAPSTEPDAWLAPPRGTPTVRVVVASLSKGTLLPAEGISLVTEEEVFGSRAHRARTAKAGKRRTKRLLEDLRSLSVGDHVVHIEHGIGRYDGLIHREVGGHVIDMLVVAYAKNDKLYLPVYRLNQIHKLRGADAKPKLDRLGGQSFSRTKARTKKKVRRIADQLLKLYAERRNATSVATPPVDDEYRAFEATFPYEETDDQSRTIVEVGADLESTQPMDRLVCGDVGFGKTEVALRAAFRVAMSGRQVAVLCPTTVLAQQHKLTFDTRLGGYPFDIRVLSRFQSKKEIDAALRGIKEGTVDIVVGTHRVLSKDVRFKKLGLLVVDEEQRFGVTAKERIKELKTNVDVLTLSATPIPRTLQMAISGLRDLSVMATPPADRRAVRTVVTRRDASVLQRAIERELARGGQIFFVYNRISGLAERANLVQELAPRARVGVAHGRMGESALERTMVAFVEGELDVLVTTAIIENGLDIPRANTIIIDGADLLGLAQLYQLRGRVGRSKERGYCYLVLPAERSITDEARTRIEALQRYSDLSSGMLLASLDLDLRGAGDMLGAEQTGTVASVGFDLFCSMLEDVAAELRGEETAPEIDPELSFDVEALLPERYVIDVGVRLSLYKRLASALDEGEVEELAEEMQDRFGRPPPAARRYVHLMMLKVALRRLRVLACEASARAVTLHLAPDAPFDPATLAGLVASSAGRYKLTPDMRLSRRTGSDEAFDNGIDAANRMLDELAPAVTS